MVYYLCYYSKATKPFNENTLTALLNLWRKKNTTLKITGLLLYTNGSIIQLLEGEQRQVEKLFKTISADKRHLKVTEIANGKTAERRFTDWSMGFYTLKNNELNDLSGYNNLENFNKWMPVKTNENHPAIVVMELFYNIEKLNKKVQTF